MGWCVAACTHHNDGVLDEGLGADQLVVARVVHHVEDTRLAGAHWVVEQNRGDRKGIKKSKNKTQET